MAIMFDHEIKVTMTVYVRSIIVGELDNKDDILDAVKEEIEHMTTDKAFDDYEIINTTVGDY